MCLKFFLSVALGIVCGANPGWAEESPPAPENASPELKPGEFEWHPERSESGPVLMVVSRDDQVMYVYRNAIEIARSTVSTGKKGHDTPTGVFQILQKHKDHYSSIYKGAAMPYMQRLTWQGISVRLRVTVVQPLAESSAPKQHSFAAQRGRGAMVEVLS